MDISLYKKFIDWKTRPLKKTDPKNLIEFMEINGLTKINIMSFLEKDSFSDDLVNASLIWAKQKTPELLQIVYKEVKESGSVSDLEKFITLVNQLEKKNAPALNQFNFFNTIHDEKYRAIVAREARLLEAGSEK